MRAELFDAEVEPLEEVVERAVDEGTVALCVDGNT
jgi:hypothetical protein